MDKRYTNHASKKQVILVHAIQRFASGSKKIQQLQFHHYFDDIRTDSPGLFCVQVHLLSTGRQLKVICISLCEPVNIPREL